MSSARLVESRTPHETDVLIGASEPVGMSACFHDNGRQMRKEQRNRAARWKEEGRGKSWVLVPAGGSVFPLQARSSSNTHGWTASTGPTWLPNFESAPLNQPLRLDVGGCCRNMIIVLFRTWAQKCLPLLPLSGLERGSEQPSTVYSRYRTRVCFFNLLS